MAKSTYWQMLYGRGKELSYIKLFKNVEDFTSIQIELLYWLEIYSQVYNALARKDSLLTTEIINNEIQLDAYLYYKSKHEDKKEKSRFKKSKRNLTGLPTLIQKKGRK